MAKQIFSDNPHNNKIINKNGNKLLFKSVEDKSVQSAEYLVQKFLYNSKHIPFCMDYSEAGFLEEFLKGRTFNELPSFSEAEIISIARGLAQVHSIEPTKFDIKIFDNLIYDNLKYNPLKVYELIVGESKKWLKCHIDLSKIEKALDLLVSDLSKIDYKLSIVHGDMSGNNIFFTESGEIKFIDWTDCRIDIGISDVVQFFFLTDLEEKYQDIFIREYNSPLGFGRMLEVQSIFFELYSLVYEYRITQEVDQHFLERINSRIERLSV